MFMKQFALLITSLFLVTACGSKHDREYTYITPEAPNDKACVKDCMGNKLSCEHDCKLNKGTCQISDRLPRQYRQYKSSVGVVPTSYNGTNVNNISCRTDQCFKRCDYSYNHCFQSCGGKVVIR